MNRKREAMTTRTSAATMLPTVRFIILVFGILLGIYLPARIGRRLMAVSSLFVPAGSTPPPPIPEVAWLMTYPNSGTTYTLKLIQQYTNTTTATNYGNEQSRHETSIPVHPGRKGEHGPYLRYTHWNLPPRYILTKTHCGGRTLSSDPREYFETTESFETACRSGNQLGGGAEGGKNETYQHSQVVYSMDIPKRIVHLIRNPFDVSSMHTPPSFMACVSLPYIPPDQSLMFCFSKNIVARLHLEERRWSRSENRTNKLQLFNTTREGFRAWCMDQDRRSFKIHRKNPFLDDDVWNIAKRVPCHDELIRYTWWHNHAIEVARRSNLPVHTFFYEDYETSWNRTVEELFRFLSLSPAQGASPLLFVPGKHYMEYYERSDTAMAERLVQTMASRETWTLLQHYFSQ